MSRQREVMSHSTGTITEWRHNERIVAAQIRGMIRHESPNSPR